MYGQQQNRKLNHRSFTKSSVSHLDLVWNWLIRSLRNSCSHCNKAVAEFLNLTTYIGPVGRPGQLTRPQAQGQTEVVSRPARAAPASKTHRPIRFCIARATASQFGGPARRVPPGRLSLSPAWRARAGQAPELRPRRPPGPLSGEHSVTYASDNRDRAVT
jgi:hypothetical protein